MYGYVLQVPTGLPETVWACRTVVHDYAWENRNHADQIEFSICTAAERTYCIGEQAPVRLTGTTLSCLIGESDVRCQAETGVAVEIASIAVRFPTLSVVEREIGEGEVTDPSVLLIPLSIHDLSDKELSAFEYLFHRYIHAYVEQSASSEMLCRSIVFELLHRLDELARRRSAKKKDKYKNYYVRKADWMITRRYAEKLTLQQIARELGITPSYLSSIYKASMGVCFSDRLLEVRIKKAEELLVSSNCTVSALAEKVGLGDESNLRKRFKQYFGISIREYRSIAKEQTLYHDKPLRKTGKEN